MFCSLNIILLIYLSLLYTYIPDLVCNLQSELTTGSPYPSLFSDILLSWQWSKKSLPDLGIIHHCHSSTMFYHYIPTFDGFVFACEGLNHPFGSDTNHHLCWQNPLFRMVSKPFHLIFSHLLMVVTSIFHIFSYLSRCFKPLPARTLHPLVPPVPWPAPSRRCGSVPCRHCRRRCTQRSRHSGRASEAAAARSLGNEASRNSWVWAKN